MKKLFLNSVIIVALVLLFSACKDKINNPDEKVTIDGVVVNSERTPLARAQVVLFKGYDAIDTVITNTRGNFSFEINKDEIRSYSVRVRLDGYIGLDKAAADFFENNKPKTQYLVLNEARNSDCCGFLKLYVFDESTNKAISRAEVNLFSGDRTISSLITGEDGFVVFDSLCTGEYGVKILHKEYRNKSFEFTQNGDCDTVYKRISLERASNTDERCCDNVFIANVKDKEGNPVKNSRIVLRQKGIPMYHGTTNEDGVLKIRGICTGEYSLLIQSNTFYYEDSFQVFGCGEEIEKDITLKVMNNTDCCDNILNLRIKDEDGEDIDEAIVRLRVNGKVMYDTISGYNGKAVLRGICRGSYSLLVKKDGYLAQEINLDFTCSQEIEKRVILKKADSLCCDASYKVYAFDSNTKETLNGAIVRIWQDGKLYKSQKVENGYALFTGICEGAYAIDISYEGYNAIEWSTEIKCKDNVIEKFLDKK